MRSQTTPRTIAGRVNADGTPGSGGNFSCRKYSTGSYYIMFPPDFRLRSCVASTLTGSSFGTVNAYYAPGTVGIGPAVAVAMAVYAGGAGDSAFSFVAVEAG